MQHLEDGLEFLDDETNEKVVFNYYTFREILKGCIVHYGNTDLTSAEKSIAQWHALKVPIESVDHVYFFSHEHPYHWAMICLHGEGYWQRYPGLEKIPTDFNQWEDNFVTQHNLCKTIFEFQ